MLQITNQKLFNQIVTEALAKVQSHPYTSQDTKTRWTNAINKAVEMVESDQANFMEFDVEANQLIIWSQTSNNIYSSNGVCQCRAFELGQPCKHRALARILRLYFEALNSPSPTAPAKVIACAPKTIHEDATAIYSKPQRQSEKIAGFRI